MTPLGLRQMPAWFVRVLLFVALGGIAAVILATIAEAAPIVRAETDSVVITIYSEPCALAEVTNLPRRATWVEKGKTFEGCAGAMPDFGVAVFYFREDRTVTAVPLQAFTRVTGV